MNEKEIKNLADCIEKGKNPVEVDGYGSELTHQWYLTWLLDSRHWRDAREAIDLLIDSPSSYKCPEDNKGYQEIAEQWKRNFPQEFWCNFEYPIGNKGEVDLFLRSEDGTGLGLPIELKVDGKFDKDQLKKYSYGREDKLGLVFLLGSSSVRHDSFPDSNDNIIGCWKWITIDDILTVWKCLYESMPQQGKIWYDSLENEALRLNCAFEIENYDTSISGSKDPDWRKKYGYRGNNIKKHLYFSKLNSVKNMLYEKKNKGLMEWELYDTRNNTVLNLNSEEYPWKNILNLGENKYYWEFNDDILVLKVEFENECGDHGIREWIDKIQDSFKQGWNWPDRVKLNQIRKPRSDAKWHVSVLRWELNFDSAESVADQAVKIIKLVDNSKILDK